MLFNATITSVNKNTRTSGSGILNSKRIKRVYQNGSGNTELEYDRGNNIQLIEVSETEAQVQAAMNANNGTAVMSVVVIDKGVPVEARIIVDQVVIGLPSPRDPNKTNLFIFDSNTNAGSGSYVVNEDVDAILEKAGNQFTTTVNLSAGSNEISHNMGLRARFVEFDDGSNGDYIWIVNVADPLNKIDVTSAETSNNVTINIIAY